MALITLGSDSILGASRDGERARLVKDARKLYDLVKAAKIPTINTPQGDKILERLAQSGQSLIKAIGYPKAMHLLSALNNLGQRNWRYLEAAEKDPEELKKLVTQLQAAFADVKARRDAERAKLYADIKGALAGKKAHRKRDARGLDKETADFFRTHKLVRVPGQKKGRAKYVKVLGNACMGGVGSLLLLAAGGAAGAYFAMKIANKTENKGSSRALLDFFIRYALAKKNKTNLPKEEFVAASSLATSLNLPKTAAAITSESGLPKDEMWPGTTLSVDTYVKTELLKLGIINAVSSAQQTWETVKQLPGTVKGNTMREDLDLGREEDMQGVYGCGVDDIVGQARARAGRRRPVSPRPLMPVSPVRAPRPRVEIIEMPPLEIRAGRTSPSMATIDPGLAAILSQLRKGTESVRSVTPTAQHRQHKGWPGNRGGYPY